MKRSFLRVFCVFLLFLTACSFTVRKNPITENFTCSFTAEYEEMQLGGIIQRGEAGSVTLVLSSPASLNGLVCRLEGEEMTLSLGGLEYKTDVIPVAAVPRLLREVLDALRHADMHTEGEITTCMGTVGTYTFEACVTAKEGFVQSLSVPDAKLEMQFTEVQKTER